MLWLTQVLYPPQTPPFKPMARLSSPVWYDSLQNSLMSKMGYFLVDIRK